MARKRYRSDVIDVVLRIDEETYRRLAEKFSSVEEVLQVAAQQLAEADKKSIADLLKLDKQYELANLAYSFLVDFQRSLREVKSFDLSFANDKDLYEYIIYVLALKYAILRRTLKVLKALRIPPQYKKKVELLLVGSMPHNDEYGGGDAYS